MRESAIAIFSSANSRTESIRSRPLAVATVRATAFNGGTSDPAQWIAIAVCSFVRWILVRDPQFFTSLKSFANAALVTAGGPPKANCLGPVMTKGFKLRHCGKIGL